MTTPIRTPDQQLAVDLAAAIRGLIVETAANAPRSLQVAIGPSEVGEPCDRKLAYKILDWPAVNTGGDPWASILGTALHAWMAELFEARNETLGWARYKVEERVTVREGYTDAATLAGSSDLYDRLTGTVWDWKLSGKTSIDNYRRKGPGAQYRTQAHLYGLGQENAGETPQRVAICFLPRYHVLEPFVWTEPYDRQIALSGLERLDAIRNAVIAVDPEANPPMWEGFPASPDAKCGWCPYFRPGSSDLSLACPGNPEREQRRDPLHSLIA